MSVEDFKSDVTSKYGGDNKSSGHLDAFLSYVPYYSDDGRTVDTDAIVQMLEDMFESSPQTFDSFLQVVFSL